MMQVESTLKKLTDKIAQVESAPAPTLEPQFLYGLTSHAGEIEDDTADPFI